MNAPMPPGPQLRTDVVDDWNAQFADGRRETEVEVRKVDRDQYVGPFAASTFDQTADHRVRARQHPDGFRQPGDGEPAIVAFEIRAGLAQPVAAETRDAAARITLAERSDERSGVQIARRFAAGNHHRAHAGASVPWAGRASCRRGSRCRPMQIRSGHVEIPKRDEVIAIEAQALQLRRESGRVPHKHHRQSVGCRYVRATRWMSSGVMAFTRSRYVSSSESGKP